MPRIPQRPRRAVFSLAFAAVAVTALTALSPSAAGAQTAAAAYEKAKEQSVRALAAPTPTADAIRRAARAYETVVRRYPTSGYSDNALWEASCLMQRAFEISTDRKDRDAAARYFAWLQTEYPGSALGRQPGPRPAPLPGADTPPPAVPTPPALAAPTTPRPVTLQSISHTELPRGDRITIELGDEVAYTGERVANPDRVFFDFANAKTAAVLAERARAIHSSLIKTVRVGQPTPGVTRVVLELTGAPRFSTFPLYGPFRLVIDIETAAAPITETPAAAAAPATTPPAPAPPLPQAQSTLAAPVPAAAPPAAATPVPTPTATPAPPASTKSGDYSLSRQLGLRVARIVIDPGHGGHDPGAQANGVTEAELVLDVALRLEKLLLQQAGVEVVLTRRTNEFIPLEERTAIANRENADLFLSIHANAHRQSSVRGVETYFLNFASNPEAEAVAARENATSAQTMGTLPAIVKAITLNNKLAESRELASLLQTQLVRRLRTQSSAVKDLGVKQAPFVVLIGAQMPSVLTEVAFLTNRSEASLLKQSAYRQQISQALRDSIVRYRESLKKVTAVATREGTR